MRRECPGHDVDNRKSTDKQAVQHDYLPEQKQFERVFIGSDEAVFPLIRGTMTRWPYYERWVAQDSEY